MLSCSEVAPASDGVSTVNAIILMCAAAHCVELESKARNLFIVFWLQSLKPITVIMVNPQQPGVFQQPRGVILQPQKTNNVTALPCALPFFSVRRTVESSRSDCRLSLLVQLHPRCTSALQAQTLPHR